jgi:Domain of unknown function (DUF5658)
LFAAQVFQSTGDSMKSAIFTVLLLVSAVQAQPNALATNSVPDAPSAQKFWNLENKVDFSILAGQVTVDAITTQHGLNNGFRETNPVMRPLVTRGAAGEAAASSIGFGFAVGTAYLLHRTHHYKAERIAVRTMLAVEGGYVANNILRLY